MKHHKLVNVISSKNNVNLTCPVESPVFGPEPLYKIKFDQERIFSGLFQQEWLKAPRVLFKTNQQLQDT